MDLLVFLHVSCIFSAAIVVSTYGCDDECDAARSELIKSACYLDNQNDTSLRDEYYSEVRKRHQEFGDDYGRYDCYQVFVTSMCLSRFDNAR